MRKKFFCNNKNLIFRSVFLLMCAITLFAINNYTTSQFSTGESVGDGATMAKLYVNSPNTDSISVDFNGSVGNEKTISFQIVNFNENVANEVLLDYTIKVNTVYGNLPLEYKLTCTSIDEGNNVSFNNTFYASGHEWFGGKLLASTHCTHAYTLTIRWVNGQYDASTYANEVDLIKITIDSEQID